MFMVTFKLKKKRVLVAAALMLVVVMAVVGAGPLFGSDAVATSGDNVGRPQRPARVRTNEHRLDFIRSFGWEVEPEPVEIVEVVIPLQFDSMYEEYNALQRQVGFDLSQHAGKRARRFTYIVTNYPGRDQDVRLNLLVRDNRVIGGDIYSAGPDAFMHGLAMPEHQSSQQPAQAE